MSTGKLWFIFDLADLAQSARLAEEARAEFPQYRIEGATNLHVFSGPAQGRIMFYAVPIEERDRIAQWVGEKLGAEVIRADEEWKP